MKSLVLSLVVASILSNILAFVFASRQWASRGGLRVVLFTDRLSRNTSLVALPVAVVAILAVYSITFVLLLSNHPAGGFGTAPALFLPSMLLVVASSIEGQYGRGIYLRKGKAPVHISASRMEVSRDRVVLVSEGEEYSRFFFSRVRE